MNGDNSMVEINDDAFQFRTYFDGHKWRARLILQKNLKYTLKKMKFIDPIKEQARKIYLQLCGVDIET